MNTLESEAEIFGDGNLKLLSPIPTWLKPGRAHVILVVDSPPPPITPQPGSLKGFWMAPDFDEPLEDFKHA